MNHRSRPPRAVAIALALPLREQPIGVLDMLSALVRTVVDGLLRALR